MWRHDNKILMRALQLQACVNYTENSLLLALLFPYMVRSLIASLRLRPCACVRPARLKLLWYYRMNEKNYELAQSLVPKSYLTLAAQAHHQREHLLTNLLAQVSHAHLPPTHLSYLLIPHLNHNLPNISCHPFIPYHTLSSYLLHFSSLIHRGVFLNLVGMTQQLSLSSTLFLGWIATTSSKILVLVRGKGELQVVLLPDVISGSFIYFLLSPH